MSEEKITNSMPEIKQTKYRSDLPERRISGRPPTEYVSYLHDTAVQYMLSAGIDVDTICEKLHISKSLFMQWKRDYPSFAQALKKGRAPVDQNVVNALYRSALGDMRIKEEYAWIYPTAQELQDALDAGDPIPRKHWGIVKATKQRDAVNVLAAIYWTKNRQPEQWHDRKEVAHSGQIEYTITPPPPPPKLVSGVGDAQTTYIDVQDTHDMQDADKGIDAVQDAVQVAGKHTQAQVHGRRSSISKAGAVNAVIGAGGIDSIMDDIGNNE